MAKMKVYELAKEINVPSKDVVSFLTSRGSLVKSHSSNIEDAEIEQVKKHFTAADTKPAQGKGNPKQAEPNKPDTKTAEPASETKAEVPKDRAVPTPNSGTAPQGNPSVQRAGQPAGQPVGQLAGQPAGQPVSGQSGQPGNQRPMQQRPQGMPGNGMPNNGAPGNGMPGTHHGMPGNGMPHSMQGGMPGGGHPHGAQSGMQGNGQMHNGIPNGGQPGNQRPMQQRPQSMQGSMQGSMPGNMPGNGMPHNGMMQGGNGMPPGSRPMGQPNHGQPGSGMPRNGQPNSGMRMPGNMPPNGMQGNGLPGNGVPGNRPPQGHNGMPGGGPNGQPGPGFRPRPQGNLPGSMPGNGTPNGMPRGGMVQGGNGMPNGNRPMNAQKGSNMPGNGQPGPNNGMPGNRPPRMQGNPLPGNNIPGNIQGNMQGNMPGNNIPGNGMQGNLPGSMPGNNVQGNGMQGNTNGLPNNGQKNNGQPNNGMPNNGTQNTGTPNNTIQGNRPQQGYNGMQNNGGQNVSQGNGQPGTGFRPTQQRQQGNGQPNNGMRDSRPMGDRPNDRPGNDRPSGDRPAGDRPNSSRPGSDRPQGSLLNRGAQIGTLGNVYRQSGERLGGDRPGSDRGDRRPMGERQQGDRRPGGDRNSGGFSGDRRSQGASGGQRSGGFSGNRGGQQGMPHGKERFFDKDKDADSRDRRQPSRSSKGGEKSSIKTDLANELTKEQRAAAFNNRDRDKAREKKKDREEDFDKVGRSKKGSEAGRKDPNRKGAFIKPVAVQEEKKEDEIKTIVIPESLTLKELADKMKQNPSAIVKKLLLAGKMVSINQEISFDEAEEIALEYNCIVEKEVKVNVVEELLKEEDDPEETLVTRPPVVCVMGHVDHGKTSLLDAIRATKVTEKEAGGITQHIGAYMVEVNGEKITFLDTPGHEAFTAMRMRGAKSTDIAILVIAADDGVMPQTVEAINHAKAAGIEIIVAVNKIDKPSANVERVKQELTEHGLVAEDWGGNTIFVPVSAHTKEGIDKLLEMILLTAEVGELRANPNRRARGIVIEARLDKGRGPVATILVQKGTLHVGDTIAIGASYGKVRAMMDDAGERVKEALPSTPVEVLGLNGVPDAGEIFIATESEKEARTIAEAFISQGKEKLLADTKSKLSLDGLFSQIQAGNIKELNLIVKADVQGSVEAVKQSLEKLSNDEVAVRVIHGGVGAINESDVTLASASNAIIIGFNVKPDNTAKEIADREKVDLRLYRVIYNAIEDVEAAMKGMLDPEYEERIIGHAEVRQTFKASGVGMIAGSYVLDGKIVRGCSARITREGTQIFDGALASLKRFKDDVKEVATGYECGLVFEKFSDLQEFDQIEFYMMVEVPRK